MPAQPDLASRLAPLLVQLQAGILDAMQYAELSAEIMQHCTTDTTDSDRTSGWVHVLICQMLTQKCS